MIGVLAEAVGIFATYPALAVAGIGFGLAFALSTGSLARDAFRGAR